MKSTRFVSLLALGAFAGCSEPTETGTDQKNLDRPVDVSFACYGGLVITGQTMPTTSAQPIASCEYRSGPRVNDTDPTPVPPGQEGASTPQWYAFVLQSAPGTVAVARFAPKPADLLSGIDVSVLDAAQLTPGKNSISVGEDPIAIATDKVGCYEVVANAGSCDLSTFDVQRAVDAAEGGVAVPTVTRLDVTNAAGEVIRARPAAMVFEPPGGVIGEACPATPTGLAYIAYPSCHMVAGVDVSTGKIVTHITYDAMGTPTVVPDGNISCPAECDGAAATPGFRPVALDLETEPRMGSIVLGVGADNSNALTAFELDPQTSLPFSPYPPIRLENTNGRLGITSLAISPLIGMGGDLGQQTGIIDDTAPGGDHRFIYAVTNDGSVRVTDISGSPSECDAQVDPRYLRSVRDVNRLACLKVGDPTTPPRRAGARGPGIELIGDAVATSVDVARVEKLPDGSSSYVGYFGLITSADGRVYVFNVDNDAFADYIPTDEPRDAISFPLALDLPHQLRDSVPERDLFAETGGDPDKGIPASIICTDPGPDPDTQGGTSGGPRMAGTIQRGLPAGFVSLEKSGGLPSIRQVFCDSNAPENDDRPVSELFFSAPPEVRDEVFPDLRELRSDETWSITYEGSLSNDKPDSAVDGPAVRTGQLSIDSFGLHLLDASRPYCDAGVEPYDIVQLRGCDPTLGDAGCPIGYTCYVHPQSQVTGIGACMLADEAERFSTACKSFLTSLRRYTVGRTKSGELQLLPRKVVLRTTPLGGCDTDAQCDALADYAVATASSLNPGDPAEPTDVHPWACQADPDRRPRDATTTGKRCLLTCKTDADCTFGTVCQENAAAPAPQMGYCMEGVLPPQACINAPQRYELRAGEAFTVVGSLHGYIHSIIADSADVCVKDPNANPFQVGRIPLDPPDCDPTADPFTGKLADGSYDANPCKQTVQETERQLNYVPGSCTLADPDELLVTRDAEGLRFRNPAMQLTLVDPTYPGDLMCHGDRKGDPRLAGLEVPMVPQAYQMSFRQVAGFTPTRILGISPALPIKVARGPVNTFWVIDEGDFLSTSIGTASTRGKVYRIELSRGTLNVLE